MKPRYFYSGRMLFSGVESTKLFPSIADAIFDFDALRAFIAPVPTAHGEPLKEWRGRGGWWVIQTCIWEDRPERPSVNLRGEFRDPVDAFEFAEMKAKKEDNKHASWHVEFTWEKSDGRLAVLEKLAADWLTRTRKARNKARDKARRLAA